MTWKKEVEELEYRSRLIKEMGGKENIEKHHKRGKLTARERIEKFADKDSFNEIMPLVGDTSYDGEKIKKYLT